MSSRTRVTGMYSGIDTEGLIQQLVEAKKTKVTTATKAQSKITYQQDAWKDLNTKLKNLKTKFDNIRYSSAYSKMTTEVSDSSIASVITSDSAMNAVQSLEVKSLAKAGYMTGAEIQNNGEKATAGTKLTDLGIEAGSKLSITVGDKTTSIEVNDSMTLGGLANSLSAAGVSANFDTSTQRLFIGAKDTGEKYDFAITADNAKGLSALSKLGILEKAEFDSNGNAVNKLAKQYAKVANTTAAERQSSIDALAKKNADSIVSQYNKLVSANAGIDDSIKELKDKYSEDTTYPDGATFDITAALSDDEKTKLAELKEKLAKTDEDNPLTDEDKANIAKEIDLLEARNSYAELAKTKSDNESKMSELEARLADVEKDEDGKITSANAGAGLIEDAAKFVDDQIATAKAAVNGGSLTTKTGSAISATGSTTLGDLTGSSFSNLGLVLNGERVEFSSDMTVDDFVSKLNEYGMGASFDETTGQISFTGDITDRGASGKALMSALGISSDKVSTETTSFAGTATKVAASDAEISLNGATFTSTSNTFDINGLTITAKAETNGKPVTLNTTKDTSAVYDMIKDVVKAYSEVVNELDKYYNASTKTKYDPLTDEEKSAMSDYEVEKWEEKLKEQVLAKDPTISNISSAFIGIMNQGFEVNGKTMYLFDFGIETAGYFNASDNEKNALHIYGDEDDETFKTETNKLQALIASDPDAVTKFFTQLSDAMYQRMTDLSSRVANTRSYGSFFDDVKMKSDYDDYTTKISDLEQKLSDYEDKWYDKFAKMETAMAKMQSNQNAIAGLLGG